MKPSWLAFPAALFITFAACTSRDPSLGPSDSARGTQDRIDSGAGREVNGSLSDQNSNDVTLPSTSESGYDMVDSSSDAGSPADGSFASADVFVSTDARDPDGGSPAVELNGLLFDVPCSTATQSGNCKATAATLAKMQTVQFGGDPNVTYSVRLHFCGPVEGRPYQKCAENQATYFCTDGVAATSGFNPTYPVYEMKVSAPAHSYFINNRDLKDDLFKIDYSAVVQVRGGSTITFSTTSEGADIYTSRLKGHNFTCPGVPSIQQPFAGQFFYVTVESIAPAP